MQDSLSCLWTWFCKRTERLRNLGLPAGMSVWSCSSGLGLWVPVCCSCPRRSRPRAHCWDGCSGLLPCPAALTRSLTTCSRGSCGARWAVLPGVFIKVSQNKHGNLANEQLPVQIPHLVQQKYSKILWHTSFISWRLQQIGVSPHQELPEE